MSFRLSPRQWQQIFDFQAREIERLASDAEHARSASRTKQYAAIGSWLRLDKGSRVLELGCGPGRFVAMLSRLGFDVTGVDPCQAASYPSWEVIKGHCNVEFHENTFAEKLPYIDDYFDQVACIGAFLYFADPVRALAEIRRVLKPDGRLLIRTINRRNLYRLVRGRNIDPAAPNAYSMAELKLLLRDAGFSVEKSFHHGFYPPVFPGLWWWLVNGKIPQWMQDALSATTPPLLRTNLVLFCESADVSSRP